MGWFVSIRWFAGVAALLLVLVGWHAFDVRIPPRPVAITIGMLFIYNALFLLLVTDAYRHQRVSPMFVLEALRSGADGVLVTGCHLGDCHYISGNERAIQNIDMAHSLIGLLGIEPQRLRLEWISAAEGARFAELITEFTDQIRGLGANPLPKGHTGKIREGATIS